MGECSREFQRWPQQLHETEDGVTVFEGKGHASSLKEPWDLRRTAVAEVVAKKRWPKRGALKSFQVSLEDVKREKKNNNLIESEKHKIICSYAISNNHQHFYIV